MNDCPSCGHAVKVVRGTTQYYEPVGCLQLVDDHQVCDQQRAETVRLGNQLAAALGWWFEGDVEVLGQSVSPNDLAVTALDAWRAHVERQPGKPAEPERAT